jgi:OOP family OmpA-OmpF porin
MEKEDKANGANSTAAFAELRRLIVGPEREQLTTLKQRIDGLDLRKDVSEVLPSAIRIRASRDSALPAAMYPVVEESILFSIRRDPAVLSDALFPIIGAAVRKAVASSLQGMMQALNQTMEQSLSWRSIGWRIEAMRTGKSFAEIVLVRSLLYRVEQVFLIHKRTGLLLQQRVAESAVVRDPALVSGMLTAIQDFVRDSFGVQANQELETLRVGDLDVWIQHSPHAILAAVIRGTPPSELQSVFAGSLEEISRNQGSELEHFDGDTAPFAACQEQLKACMLGQGTHTDKHYAALWWLAGALAILAFGLGIYLGRGEFRRWDEYVAKLKSQPGIAITSVEKHGGQYFVSGLRDPLAADPVALLAGSGIAASRVQFHLEPYHSLQPAFEASRRFSNETLLIDEEVIRFATNVSKLTPEEAGHVGGVARHVLLLLDTAKQIGRPVRIELTGHSDKVGTVEENMLLAARRADEVRAELVNAGVPAVQLIARAGSEATDLRGVTFRVQAIKK